MFTGDVIDGAEAARIGLANRLLPAEGFEAAVHDFAVKLAKGPPLVMRRIKRAVYASLDGDLDAALDREAEGQLQLLGSADFVEGVSAFLQKRDPVFGGK